MKINTSIIDELFELRQGKEHIRHFGFNLNKTIL